MSTLAVQGYIEGVGGPLPMNPLRVYVDHVHVGDTNASGYAELQVEPGRHVVRLVKPGRHGGDLHDVDLVEGERTLVETGLFSHQLAERAEATVVELLDGWVLPADTATLTWDLEDALGEPVHLVEEDMTTLGLGMTMHTPIGGPGSTTLLNLQGGSDTPSLVRVDDEGRMVVADMEPVHAWLAERGDVVVALSMHASDGNGLFYRHRVEVRVGHHTWTGVVSPPPGEPSLDLEGMRVRAEMFSSQRVAEAFETTLDADGRFTFEHLPTGTWALMGDLKGTDGVPYRVRDNPRLEGDLDRTYQLLSSPDIEAGLTYRLDQP